MLNRKLETVLKAFLIRKFTLQKKFDYKMPVIEAVEMNRLKAPFTLLEAFGAKTSLLGMDV